MKPKDCPKKEKCPLENTKYCKILTTLRKAGHGCCIEWKEEICT